MDSQMVDAVLSHHGQTLKKLSLHPSKKTNGRNIPLEFTKDRVLQIETQCPVLEELTIPVKRNKSSASKARIYRYFSKIKSLRSLFLILDYSKWQVTRDSAYDARFDGEDRKPLDDGEFAFLKRGELKETIINCAVDEELARSIWKTIVQSKDGRPLDRLKLWPTGMGEYGISTNLPSTFSGIARTLARSWMLERVPRDDQEQDFTIRELGQRARTARDEEDTVYLSYFHNPEVWEVLRSIWPSKEGSTSWRDDWSSFPLQT